MIPRTLQTQPLEEFELNVQEIKWLTEIGFIAPQLGRVKTALTIFHALLLCCPEADFPYLGLASTYLGIGNHLAAITLLEKTQLQHPNSMEVKCLLAMALKFDHRNNEADHLLSEIIKSEEHRSEPVYALAGELLKPDTINPKNPRR